MKPDTRSILRFVVAVCLAVSFAAPSLAQFTALASDAKEEPAETIEDSWRIKRIAGQPQQSTRELVVKARSEPRPTLRYRFLPDSFEYVDGNASLHYTKALGFLEQGPSKQKLMQYHQEQFQKAQEEGSEVWKPEVWLQIPPKELPLDEVKQYLSLTSFQPEIMREAARRNRFDADRHIRDVNNIIGVLLPEIQAMRELARTQSLRCRFAIAEDRIDDAIEIIGQQFAIARHLSQDDFLVCNLVGVAIAGIACNDLQYVVEHKDAPNLYWALSALPQPLVSLEHALAVERQFLFLQVKSLQDVSEEPRSAGYWRDFIDRIAPQIGVLGSEIGLQKYLDIENSEAMRTALIAFVVAGYPDAKDYLLNVEKMDPEQVEAYPTAQVVFLAMTRFQEYWRDEYFKWSYLPFSQTRVVLQANEMEPRLQDDAKRYGLIALPTSKMLPAVQAAFKAQVRCEQKIALSRTVEAVRLFAAENEGALPETLADLTVPVPIEPFTGQPIEYKREGDKAIISGHPLSNLQYHIIVRIAKE